MQRIVSIILLGVGLILLYIFAMTFIGSLDGGRYLFFEIILMIVWGIGSSIFLLFGTLLFRNDNKRRKFKEDNMENE